MITNDELWEKAKSHEPITSEDLGIEREKDDSGLVFYNDGFIRKEDIKKSMILGVMIIFVPMVILIVALKHYT